MALDGDHALANYEFDEQNDMINYPISFDHYRDAIYTNPNLNIFNNLSNSNVNQEDLVIDNVTCEYYDLKNFHELLLGGTYQCNVIFNNIRSIPKNFDEFVTINLDQLIQKFNIVGFCETRLTNDIENLFQIEGFSQFTNNNSRSKGGVALYCNSSLKCKVIKDLSLMYDHIESLFIESSTRGIKITYGIIYRRPGTDIDAFLSDLNQILLNPAVRSSKCIIMGDFNLNLLENTRHTNDYANIFYSSNFCARTTRPTRVSSTSATLIDHIWSNFTDLDQLNGILMNDQSDHFSPFLLSSQIQPQNQPRTFRFRNYKASDQRLILHCLEENFSNFSVEGEINDTFDRFIKILQDTMDVCYPYQTVTIKPKAIKNPWMTDELRLLIKDRDKLHSKYCERPITYGAAYRSLRNRVNRLIAAKKKDFYNKEFNEVKGNQKETWKKLSKLLNTSSKSDLEIKELIVNQHTITDSQTICNSLNNYFSNVGCNDDMEDVPNIHFTDYLRGEYPDLNFAMVDVAAIKKIIKKMKKSGPGPDDISIQLIKEGSDFLSPILTEMINKCLTSGVYPDALKVAKVVPIFKGGERNKPDNYRQISILSSLNKIVERVIFTQLLEHAEVNNILVPQQFGFRKGMSTTDAILHFLKKIHENSAQFKFTAAFMFDLAKAFDSINIQILLEKLKFYGLKDNSFKIMESYLSGRRQFTTVNGCKSTASPITQGVPQGSILGPLLFLYFINDFVNCSNRLIFTIFADDSSGLLGSNSLQELRLLAIEELKNVSNWLKSNRIKANIKKTHFLIFGGKTSSDFSLHITLNNKTLSHRAVTKMLGVMIDKNLNWSEHIMSVNRKISRVNGILFRLSKFLNTETLKIIYNSLIYPHLQYGNLAWGNAAAKYTNRLLVAQKRAIRTISHAEYLAHTNDLFKENKLLKLHDIYTLECVKFVKRELDKDSFEFFSYRQNDHRMVLRNENSLLVNLPQPRTELTRKFVTYSAALTWVNLPY